MTWNICCTRKCDSALSTGVRKHEESSVGKQLNVIIVESEPGHGATMVAELREQGIAFANIELKCPEELLLTLEAYPVDVIVAEYPRPSMNTFATIEALHESHPDIPLVVVTSSCDPGAIVELFEAGAAAHVHRQQSRELGSTIRFAIEGTQRSTALHRAEVIRESCKTRPGAALRERATATEVHPICPRCTRIRDSFGRWDELAVYLRMNPLATVTLVTCPDCIESGPSPTPSF